MSWAQRDADAAEEERQRVAGLDAELSAAQAELFDAKHKAEEWEESHNIERARADALEAEVQELRARLALALEMGLAECENLRARLQRSMTDYHQVLK